MRADQPVRAAAAETVSGSIARNLTTSVSEFWSLAPIGGRSSPSGTLSRIPARVCDGSGTILTAPAPDRRVPRMGTAGGLRRGRARAPVRVLEAHHVVELRRRHLKDRRVLERGHSMDRAGRGGGGRA